MLNTASETTSAWLSSYYKLVDAKNVNEFVRFFSRDAQLLFANNEPVVGRENIRAALGALLDSVAGIHHEIKRQWESSAGVLIYEVKVTYTRKEGHAVVIPGAVFCSVRDGLFTEQHIYMDLTPVYA